MALKLLKQFVENYSYIYWPQFINYNVNSLIHLPFFTNLHGSLDNFSAFEYENYLQTLKKTVNYCKYPLTEFKNKIVASEGENLLTVSPDVDSLFKSFKINENISNLITVYYNHVTLKTNNNYVLSCKNPKY